MQRASIIRCRVLAWLTLAAALSYLCRNAVGVAESTIRNDLKLTLAQSGWFMGAFFWSYALFQVPSGWLAQRYGTRIMLTISALTWAVASIGIGMAPGFWLLIAAQLMMGVAQAAVFPAGCNSIGHWMPLSQRSLSCGIMTAGMQVGAISASVLTGVLIVNFGWRPVFVVFALPSILWAICFGLQFRDRPVEDLQLNENTADSKKTAPNEGDSWVVLLSNPLIWFLCGQQMCRAAGYIFFNSWFPTFLQKTRGVSIKDSGYIQSLVLTGTLVGSVAGGMLTDWVWRVTKDLRISRSGVGVISQAICTLMILGAWIAQSTTLSVTLMAGGAFFAAIAGPCAYATTIDIGGTRVPQVFGLMNMCGNLAGAACPILVAILFGRTANWNIVLLVFAGVYLTSSICWLFVIPKRPDQSDCSPRTTELKS